MLRKLLDLSIVALASWLALSAIAGLSVLPPMLLNAPIPDTSEAQVHDIRDRLARPGDRWTLTPLQGGEGAPLQLWRLHRATSKGVAIFLHGFGDDAWGAVLRAQDLPQWDAVTFHFRGRDQHPEVPSTLGGWERQDVAAVVSNLEAQGVPRSRMILVATSQGAGVALLALSDLERSGAPLAAALLECPFKDLKDAARNHLKGALGRGELLARPAEWLALWRAGRLAHFDPAAISPLQAAKNLRTPTSILTGDADSITPLEGVQAIVTASRGAPHPIDLTLVHGAGHCMAGARFPGGWKAWAQPRIPVFDDYVN